MNQAAGHPKNSHLKAVNRSRSGSENTSSRSVMVRSITGEIQFWDRGAEAAYGFSRQAAVGNTSHSLLRTIFPEPLSKINQLLKIRKKWAGELIHTRHDGTQMKVLSEWRVMDSDSSEEMIIREVNHSFTAVVPENAQLSQPTLHEHAAARKKRWMFFIVSFLGTLVMLLTVIGSLWYLTHPNPVTPLVEVH